MPLNFAQAHRSTSVKPGCGVRHLRGSSGQVSVQDSGVEVLLGFFDTQTGHLRLALLSHGPLCVRPGNLGQTLSSGGQTGIGWGT